MAVAPEAKPMGEAEVLAFVDDYINFFDKAASKHRKTDTILRLALIILSAIVPALTASSLPGKWTAVTTIVATAVAILTTCDSYFRPASVWRHNRSAFLRLRALRRRYFRGKAKEIPEEEYSLAAFYKDAETLITTEMLAYSDLRGLQSQPVASATKNNSP
ncbi:DUF4231 domain-containing protein [Roseomonas sp. BN140053]|uniref:DUF4231 domain-containing protein n=1 Tax=Roseomonas sp. BN140053 TaxID=3391898 RepID=UPI0039E967D8